MTIGEQIRALRGILDKTQTQVAAEMGVTKTSIINWEKGYRILSPKSKDAALNWINHARNTEKYKEITRRK
jgi:transcriptional regulator with XRE-family HTH domain